jgi:hypothetical protein
VNISQQKNYNVYCEVVSSLKIGKMVAHSPCAEDGEAEAVHEGGGVAHADALRLHAAFLLTTLSKQVAVSHTVDKLNNIL